MTESAEFITIPLNPPPANGEPFYFTAEDGKRLRAAFFRAARPRGNIVLLGGRTEFIEKYFEVISDLCDRGLNVITMDWRGQGLSARMLRDRNKGHIDHFDTYIDDLRLFTEKEAVPRFCEGPVFVMAHSMGGLITLGLLAQGYRRFDRAVLCAPMTKLALPLYVRIPLRIITAAARMTGAGSLTITGGEPDRFHGNVLTSDPDRFERFRLLRLAAPQASTGAATCSWISASMTLMSRLRKTCHLEKLDTPVLVVSAQNDRVIDSSSHQDLDRRHPLVRTVTLEGALHEIMMEHDRYRNIFWSHVDRFIGPDM